MSDSTTQDGRGLRSPGYPNINLADAIARAETLHKYSPGRKPIPVDVAVKQWGYSAKSGAGLQQLAALKKFGLLEDQGSKDTRAVRLTDLAWKILTDPREESKEKAAAIREAARSPKIHAKMIDRWPHGLPDDTTVQVWLVQEEHFNEKSVPGFLKQVRETIEFAKLDTAPDTDDNADSNEDQEPIKISVGDWVQWTSQDIARFEKPRKVLGLSADGNYAFVVGSKTGVPVAELTVEKQPPEVSSQGGVPPPNPFTATAPKAEREPGCKQDVFSLDSGSVTIQWPETLTQADFNDIKDWLAILERKINRSVKPPARAPAVPEPENDLD